MNEKDKAISRAIQELKRIEQAPGTIGIYREGSLGNSNRLQLTDEFACEIAKDIADKIDNNRVKQTLRASVITFFKSGKSIDFVWSIEGFSKHFSREELINLKNSLT